MPISSSPKKLWTHPRNTFHQRHHICSPHQPGYMAEVTMLDEPRACSLSSIYPGQMQHKHDPRLRPAAMCRIALTITPPCCQPNNEKHREKYSHILGKGFSHSTGSSSCLGICCSMHCRIKLLCEGLSNLSPAVTNWQHPTALQAKAAKVVLKDESEHFGKWKYGTMIIH